MEARATTLKGDHLEPRVFGQARWRKDWVTVSYELAQDCQARGASVRDVVNSTGNAELTHHKYK